MSPLSPSLLDDLARDALDPAYRAASDRREPPAAAAPVAAAAAEAAGGRGRGWTVGLALALALVAAGAGTAVAVQRQTGRPARAALIADVRAHTAADDALAARIDGLRAAQAAARARTLARAKQAAALGARVTALEPAVGLSAVRGPGILVRLTDAPAPVVPPPGPGGSAPADSPDAILAPVSGRVLDRDVADAVNALWAAGARAVAVGGVRLTATTAIRTAGDTILAGFTALRSPYTLTAVGDPDRLAARLAVSAAGRRLAGYRTAYGIGFSVVRQPVVTVPAAAVTMPRLARESDR